MFFRCLFVLTVLGFVLYGWGELVGWLVGIENGSLHSNLTCNATSKHNATQIVTK